MTFNKKIDRLESGTITPKSPNDETIWVDTNNNSIKRYNETNDSWVSVGGAGGAANTGDITFVGSTIIGNGTIDLVPDNTLTNDSYLIITPTDTNHIHIRAGGPSDNSDATLILGGERNKVSVSDTDRSVVISTAAPDELNYDNFWEFESNGYLTGPAMGGLFVSGILNGDNNLWLSSGSNVVISSGDGMGVFLEDESIANNQIATIGDLPSGATGTFETPDSKLVTVTNGIITAIDPLT